MAINTQQLNLFSKPISQATSARDTNSPLSYKEWYTSYTGIIPGQELALYNSYLINWYNQKKDQYTSLTTQTRLNYLTLLKQLQIFYSNEEAENWYSQVNLDSEKELLIAIPYFAKKLKEIALYYLNIREEIKKNKIKYNVVGTTTGVTQELQEQLLTLFTKRPNQSVSIPSSIWTNISELSSVKDNLVIQFEELYDDHEYSDQSATLPVSAYYNLDSKNLKDFFETKNLPLTATNWIYKQGTYDINDEELTFNIDLATQILQKYIGENKFAVSTSTPAPSSSTEFYDIVISSGNNNFYWPKGVYKPDISTVTIYKPVPLTASNIQDLGVAGDSILNSDTIFVKSAKGIEGAWLRFKQYDETDAAVNSYIEGNKTTTFKFPFPGFGLSGEDIEWSGPSLNFTTEYSYLETEIKEAINAAYWNTDTSNFQITPISLNSTTLIDSGAYANDSYLLADKITIRPNPPLYDSTNYSGEIQEAWLYKITKTDIPVNIGNSVIVWPYQRVDPNEQFPSYIPSNINTVCEPLNLSSIPVPGATSSRYLSSADKIYKIQNYTDTIDLAVECAWLSGTEAIYENRTGVSQPSLNGIFKSGEYSRFIWEGPDLTDADLVFKTIKHQPDCTFTTTATSYKDFSLCTCYQTLFTPFGHSGTDYDDNNRVADFIAEDLVPFEAFNLLSWRDIFSTNYTSSSAFGWYRTNKEIGWGDGSWRTGSSLVDNKLYLRYGKTYIYYRAKDTSLNNTLPELVIRYPYLNPSVKWMKAIKNEINEWVSTDSEADMVIRPGDLLIYEKTATTSYDYISSSTNIQNIGPTAANINTIWSDYNYVTIGASQFGIPQSVTVFYPTDIFTVNGARDVDLSTDYSQYPFTNYNNIVNGVVNWKLTDPFNQEYFINNVARFTFQPNVTGVYTVMLTAITAAKILPGKTYTSTESGLMIFSDIPPITAIDTYITQTTNLSTYSIIRNVPGFVINAQLYGWNYNTNKPASNTIGARPYWANSSTLYRDIDSWGTPFRLVDNYNIVTQPIISDIQLNANNLFEYERKYSTSFSWVQPINYKTEVNESVWSTIYFNTTGASNFEHILNNLTNQLVARVSNDTSPIIFQNIVNNQPVEVWYKALNSFIWNITAEPSINSVVYSNPIPELRIAADRPWNNLTNRYFPKYNITPALDSLYTEQDRGGFFTPNNLGISTYLNKDFIGVLQISSTALSGVFEDASTRVGGRGLTKADQPTPYTQVIENNIWLKEPIVSGPIAGTIKKQITKKYQKFIPYQSTYETNPRSQVGLILPTSRQTPWGADQDLLWTDTANKPESFSGVPNVSAWGQSQILKNTSKMLTNWVTDIFGNQYGLYKDLQDLNSFSNRYTPGEIWIRKNSQFVSPAQIALSAVFDTYKAYNFYNQLTGDGVRKIDMFFNTLYIETSSIILLEDINFNYETDNIFSISDNSRQIPLIYASNDQNISQTLLTPASTIPVIPGDTWFFPENKKVILTVCGLDNTVLYPFLYEYSLISKDLIKVFPKNLSDINTINTLSSLDIQVIEPPVISYDELKKEFILTILGRNTNNKDNIIEISINNLPDMVLNDINVYTPTETLYNKVPPFVISPLSISTSANNIFTYTVSALNEPNTYTLLTATNWASVNNFGVFSLTSPSLIGNYFLPFVVSNNIGPTYYSLHINVTA